MTEVRGSWRRAAGGARLLDAEGRVAPTIFAELSARAAQTGAINLGQGFPDEDGPTEVLEAARAAIASGRNQYPPGRGVPELLEAVAEHQERFYGIHLDPRTEIIATAGATEALTATLLALLSPGDEVVVFEPFYDSYAAAIALAGAHLVPVRLRWPDFQPDLAELEAAVTARTRAIVVNDPHNPTGAVFSDAVRRSVVDLAIRHDLVVITDEVYEHLVWGATHTPIASVPGAASRTVSISSGGKTFSTTGWKIGWLSAADDVVTAILTVKQYLTYANGSPLQPAIARGLRMPDEFFAELARDMKKRSALLGDGLASSDMATSRPSGTYFTVADVSPLGYDDAAAFCRMLPEKAGVIGVPVSAFVTPQHDDEYRSLVRFAACKKVDVIEEATSRLARLRG